METILKAYINEAIGVEKAGLEVSIKKNTEFVIPAELQNKFDEIPAFETAFKGLTPGRQREYILIFLKPKNLQLESQGLKNISSEFLMVRD